MAHSTTRPGDNIAHHGLKDVDGGDRFDSGIESYRSFDEMRSTSIEDQSVDNIATQISSIGITKSTTTVVPQLVPNLRPYKHDYGTSEVCDSGLVESYSSDAGYSTLNSIEREKIELELNNNDVKPETLQEETVSEPTNIYNKLFSPDVDGDTCLQLAIVKRRGDVAFEIIQMCTVPQLLDVANSDQQTALHLSVLTNQPKLTRCLVAYGANLECKDRFGNTPLHLACERGLAAQLHMLTEKLDEQEDPGLQTFCIPQNVNERNYLGFTPLQLAICNNQLEVARILIDVLKCDVNVADLKSGRTALHHAIERRSLDAVKMILEARAKVDPLTYDDCSPLHLAAARGLKLEAEYLLKKGADVFLITRDDYDVFELSAAYPRLNSILKAEAKKRRQPRYGKQP